MATRKQIAGLAGASQATISRLLNGDATLRITAATRRRIMRAASQPGYTAFTSRMIAGLDAPPQIDELKDAYFRPLLPTVRVPLPPAAAHEPFSISCPYRNPYGTRHRLQWRKTRNEDTVGILNAFAGNLQQVSNDELMHKYGPFLFNGEQITNGYQLVRDAVIFTNIRIIFIDKQGATGAKTRYRTIHLDAVVDVEVETAGAIGDDSELNITYLKDVYQRKTGTETLDEITLEFPRKFDIAPIYRYLGELAIANRERINAK